MAFPETRLSLIERLASSPTETDWRDFLADYWRPVCRFASNWGGMQESDAEDVAASVFEVLIRKKLLLRWCRNRAAKLRTLLCAITRKQLSNHRRARPAPLSLENPVRSATGDGNLHDILSDQRSEDVFEKFCNDELLLQTCHQLRDELLREGKGDDFRVLYSRICEELSFQQIADLLDVPVTTAEFWFKRARDRLADLLRLRIRRLFAYDHSTGDAHTQLQTDWGLVGAELISSGGLDSALRSCLTSEQGSPLPNRQYFERLSSIASTTL